MIVFRTGGFGCCCPLVFLGICASMVLVPLAPILFVRQRHVRG